MSNVPTHKTAASKDALPPPSSGLRYPTSGKTIYHRPLNRSRTSELSQASFAYLFSEMISYAQRRVTGIQDLEKRHVQPLHLFFFFPLFFFVLLPLSDDNPADETNHLPLPPKTGSTSKATR
jgi:hypothetical protein